MTKASFLVGSALSEEQLDAVIKALSEESAELLKGDAVNLNICKVGKLLEVLTAHAHAGSQPAKDLLAVLGSEVRE